MSDVADEIVDGAGDGVDAVVDAGEETIEAVGDLADDAGEIVGDLIGVAVNSTTGVIDIFTDVIQSVGTALEEVNLKILLDKRDMTTSLFLTVIKNSIHLMT